VVGILDLPGDLAVGQRPQGRDRLHRREGEVVAGHRRGQLPGGPGEEPGALAVIERGAAVLPGEHLLGQLGADPSANLLRDRRLPVDAPLVVVGGEPARGLPQELRRVAGVDREHPAQLGGLLRRRDALAGVQGGVLQPLGVRVAALAEQVAHLLLSDLAAGLDVERRQPRAPPAAR
jgi:hypothetical protein